jgi:hypothetical protein
MKKACLRLGATVGLLLACACSDTNCGGCAGKLAGPFPAQPRVYDGAQVRLNPSALQYASQNLPVILEALLQDGLNFDLPTSQTSILGVNLTICQTPCPLHVDLLDSAITLVSPDRVNLAAHINVSGAITIDSALGHCDFPLNIQNKLIHALVVLMVDNATGFFTFDVADMTIAIESREYDIQCPVVYDWLLELLKDYITSILNSQIGPRINQEVDQLVAEQTCLPCDFYLSGCPSPSACRDGFCQSGGRCLVKPQGLAGRVQLGEMLASVDPGNTAWLDLLITPGQAQPVATQPFVRAEGLELRVIGGSYSDRAACVPEPDPADIPPVGAAPTLNFGPNIPGRGDPYMLGVAIADKYLDHLIYQVWRSGFLCLSIDSYGLDLLSSQTLSLILPSVADLAEGQNLPVRLELHPLRPPNVQVGRGSFAPDGSVDEPILYVFLPGVRLDFWMKLHGRWLLLLSIAQDLEVRLAMQFTPDNRVIPILDEDSVVVANPRLIRYELLAEEPARIQEAIPRLLAIALPQLTGALDEIAIPDLQGFVLQVLSLQGDVKRANSNYYDFLSIYANLAFSPPPPVPARPVELLWWKNGLARFRVAPGEEVQVRLDRGFWSPFKPGPVAEFQVPDIGRHRLQARARLSGDYRTLDTVGRSWVIDGARARIVSPMARPEPAENPPPALHKEGAGTGCAHAVSGGLWLLPALWLRRRRR